MKIAILTSGILPVPAVQGGAVETLVDHYLEYNDRHKAHQITVYSVYHPKVDGCSQLLSDVNHYNFIDVKSPLAKLRKRLHGLLHTESYYHYSIDYFIRRALEDILRHDYDVIIMENRPAYALLLQGKTRARLVYHLHNDFLNSETHYGGEIYRAASRILTVSDYIKSRVQTCNPRDEKTVTVHNGIDLEAFTHPSTVTRASLGFTDDDFVLLFSGRLIPEKGILELVEAIRQLNNEPRVKLLIIGSSFFDGAATNDPFVNELKAQAGALDNRIRFTGYVKHELMPDYLKTADVAVIPSTWDDPFPTTVLEAMAVSLPIITTNRGGIPEMTGTDNAIVVPYPGEFVGGLAEAIRTLCHNPQLCRQMGAASGRRSSAYTKAGYAENFFKALE